MSGEVTSWLEYLGLGEYADAFAANHIDMALLPTLTDSDLKEIGVSSLGHRKRLLAAAARLSAAARPADETAATDAGWIEPERRHLTVLFCDLVGSTALSVKLDPEDLSKLMNRYLSACGAIVRRFDGHVAKYVGDGVQAYFGWPRAHEDDAERAVRAGLAMAAAVAELAGPDGTPLATRIGIASGVVVVGDTVGTSDAPSEDIVGQTPNLAARLQARAAPGQVLIAPRTRLLIGEAFDCVYLGHHVLKGFSEPVQAWNVLGEHRLTSRFEARHARGLTPFIARQKEVDLLHDRWDQAKSGNGQVVLLSGEAGIGKSRITQALRDGIADEPQQRLRYQCSPHHTNSALYPLVHQLSNAAQFEAHDPPERKLGKLETLLAEAGAARDQVLPLIASLLSVPTGDRYPKLKLDPKRQKEMTFTVIAEHLKTLAARQPVLIVFEDAHWIDPTTQELLDLIVDRAQHVRALVLITFRPEYKPHWQGVDHVTTLPLNRLARGECAKMVERLTRNRKLPAEILDQIVAKTDGVPLFVEELTKTVIESGWVPSADGNRDSARPLLKLQVPTTLQDSLMARLDRLAPVKQLAQLAATLGRTFTRQVLAAVSAYDERELDDALAQLVDAELIYRRGPPGNARFEFKHSLVRDAAYESLLKSTRQRYHQAIARTFEDQFPEQVEQEPEVLAHHFTEAGLADRAIHYWQQAGKRATKRSANAEAVAHLTKALELLTDLPESGERDALELDLQIALTEPIVSSAGYTSPQLERTFTRALELCRRVGDTAKFFPVLNGRWVFHYGRGETEKSRELAEEFLQLAEDQRADAAQLAGNRMLGTSLLMAGELQAARTHLIRATEHDVPAEQRSITFQSGFVAGRCYLSWTLWHLGHFDQAMDCGQQAIEQARALSHANTLGIAISHAGMMLQAFCRNWEQVQSHAESLIALAVEQDLMHWSAVGAVCQGWAMCRQGNLQDGINAMQQGLTALDSTGYSHLWRPIFLGGLAEALGQFDRVEDGLKVLDEAESVTVENGERWFEAELYRLKGNLLGMTPASGDGAVAPCYLQALDIARRQNSRALELRAATSFARYLQRHDRRGEAYDLLWPIYDALTEGRSTPDLVDAKNQIKELT